MDPAQWLQAGDGNFDMGRFDEAIHCYGKAVETEPRLAAAWNSMGAAFQEKGDPERATACYEKAIEGDPGQVEARFNLGLILQNQGKWDGAGRCYRSVLKLEPDRPDALNNLGNVLHEQGRFEQALSCFRRVIALDPSYVRAYNNLGKTLQEQGKIHEAIRWYEKAVALKADYAQARFNLSLARLSCGDFAEGWKGFEWRFLTRDKKKIYPHIYSKPRWHGEPFSGKRLLVHAEQGLGDTIQFVRYLPEVKARGGTVILETLEPLFPILKNFPGIDELIVFSQDRPAGTEFDCHVPLLSLPGLFGTGPASIPAEIPYLFAPQEKVRQWEKRIPDHGLRVGIVWAGKPTHGNDRNRSIELSKLLPLLGISGVHVFGLQKGPASRQAYDAAIPNLGELFEDFSDTAAAVETMDLIISVDTAVAHLAGAMGKPVWLLLPRISDWRWLLDRQDSVWYPTMRLFRQEEAERWGKPVARIAEELKILADEGPVGGKIGSDHILKDAEKNLRNRRFKEAEAFFFKALCGLPGCAEAMHGLGLAAHETGRRLQAETWLMRAVRRQPRSSRFHYHLGLAMLSRNRQADASESFRNAAELDPGCFEARYNLALACKADGRIQEASHHFRAALRICPDSAEAGYNLANILREQGLPEEAETGYRQVLERRPDFAEAWSNLGLCLKDQGRLDDAVAAYDQAIARRPNFPEACWNRSLALLLKGELAEGWKGYEWRFRRPGGMGMPAGCRGGLRWDGSPFEGKRLLVWSEQGFGDTIQFIRYLPLVRERGGTVIFRVAPQLHGLLRGFPGIDDLMAPDRDDPAKPPWDLHVPLMSLPGFFETTLETVPVFVPYLFAEPDRVEHWRRETRIEGLRIGIAWSGNPENPFNRVRACALSHFRSLAELPGIRLFGLQKGLPASQSAEFSRTNPFVNLGEGFTDFADTAAAIEAMDLIVTTDTSVPHLAGAMGKPTWLLLSHVPDWRWLLHREDSAWYPTMRLFRQEKRGDWNGVFERVARELKRIQTPVST